MQKEITIPGLEVSLSSTTEITMLSQNINDYLAWKASCTNTAYPIYKGHLKEFLTFVGDKHMDDLSIEDLTSFRWYQLRQHKPSYVNYKMGTIRNFLRFCKEKNIQCPSTFFVPSERTESVPHYAITEKEYQKMLDVYTDYKFEDIKKRLVLMLLRDTGSRVSELRDLNLEDIDQAGRTAYILSKKTKKKYWIFWSIKTQDMMTKYLGMRLCMNSRPELIITKKGQNRPTTRTIERWVKSSATKAGLKNKIVPHGFRHKKGHHILEMGGTLADVNALLGHSYKNLNASLCYVRRDRSEMSKVGRKYI